MKDEGERGTFHPSSLIPTIGTLVATPAFYNQRGSGSEGYMYATAMWDLLKITFAEWNEDKAPRLGAALAYYTVFSLAPLLIIAVAIVGFFFEEAQARQQVVGQVGGLIGPQGTEALQSLIDNASQPGAGLIASLIGIITLLFGASGVFGQLQDSLNTIWEVQPKPGRGIWGFVKDRFLSFTLVLGTGFLLLVSLILSSMLAIVGDYLAQNLPGGDLLWQIINFVVSFAVITLLFAMIYKIIPDVDIAWGDVWIGSAVTALLFTIGRFVLNIYLSNSSTTSVYGAAGSLVVILLWVYYSAQILFLGAEFTQVYANRYGSRIVPADNAVAVTEESRAQQGIPRQQQPAPEADATPPAEQQPVPRRSVGALAGLLVGMLIGARRNRRE